MLKRIAIGFVGCCALAGGGTAAEAAIALTPASGSNSKLSYSLGETDFGLYGNPTVSGTTFLFSSPSHFRATTSNGNATTTSDRVAFVVASTDGADLKRVSVHEVGDWSILGTGIVKITGGMFLYSHDAATFGHEFDASPVVTYKNVETGATLVSPSRPVNDSSGTWFADLTYLLPSGIKSVQFVLNNNLQSIAGAASTSLIQKKGLSITFESPSTPEPASMTVVVCGVAMLARRRRA